MTNEKDHIQSKETKKVKKRDSTEKVNTETRGIIMQGQRKTYISSQHNSPLRRHKFIISIMVMVVMMMTTIVIGVP